jgi:phenylalanyl-tRNA synthetase alpha chain
MQKRSLLNPVVATPTVATFSGLMQHSCLAVNAMIRSGRTLACLQSVGRQSSRQGCGTGIKTMDDLKQKYLGQIANAQDEAGLEDIRLSAVGKKGEVALKMRELGKMTPEERQVVGPALNALKNEINSALSAKKAALGDAALDERLRSEWLDVTLPVRAQRQGSIHPVSQVTEELTAIFAELGFSVAEGPRIDTDWYNFDALNIPGHHPARAEMDTFYMHRAEGDARPQHVLRTHTSPVQIRTMEKEGAPLRIICPGGVYRADYDQTHTPMFHQVEGLAIDKNISMANLKWTLEEFFSAFFEIDGIKTRFRASHFPFTEPSAEVDIQCSWVDGQLRIGEGDGWMEVLGSGMVHPKVLAAGGIDPDIWQGFAFGMGIDRIAMLKYGIPDLRAFFDSDLRWLRHYGFASLDQPNLHGGLSR